MTVFTPSPAAGTAGGYTVEPSLDVDVLPAAATAGGYGVLVQGAPPVVGAAPDALRLEIVTAAGMQLVNDLATRRNLTFTVEHNGSGSISFDTDVDALPASVDIDDPTNLVRVHYGKLASWPYGVAEGVPASAPPAKGDSGQWSLNVQCPGSWDVLGFGVLWPPAGAVAETREFSYTAGQTGPSWVAEQWAKPYGYLVKNSWRWKHRWPRNWPESRSRWIWSSSTEKNSPDGVRKFVSDPFTLTARHDVEFFAAGDDTMKLYLNGARLKRKGRGAWHKTTRFVRRLPAGTYVVAAEVENLPGGNDKSGFICAVARLNAAGKRVEWLLRSSTTSFVYRKSGGYFAQVPLPPDGWFPPAVLYVQVGEAAARGVAFHSSIVRAFSTTKDTAGTAWVAKGPAEYDIGISGAELGEKIRSLGYDVAMLPGLRLSAWRQRGFDLRDRVVISKANNVGWSSKTWSRVRTVALIHQEQGWTETAGDAGLTDTYGRRELTVSGGGQDGDLQGAALGLSALATSASPENTISVETTSADLRAGAPQPFRDYNVADVVLVETKGGFTPMKVMSITGAEQDDKSVKFTIAGYPV